MFGRKKGHKDKPEVSKQRSIASDQPSSSLVQQRTASAQPKLTARQQSLSTGNDQSHRQRSGTHDPQTSRQPPATSDRPKSTAGNKASILPVQQRNTRPAGATAMQSSSLKQNAGIADTNTRQPIVYDKPPTNIKTLSQQPIQPGPSEASPLLIRKETESLEIDITDTTVYTTKSETVHGQTSSTDPLKILSNSIADPLYFGSDGSSKQNQVIVTFYFNSSMIDPDEAKLFSDQGMEDLANSIRGGMSDDDTPLDLMIRKEECFRRCYKFPSNDQFDESSVIVGVRVLNGTCPGLVYERIKRIYAKQVRVVTEESTPSTAAVEKVKSYTPMNPD